jgi:chromosomal replication initiator protein
MDDQILHLDLPRGDAVWQPGAALPSFVVGPENRLVALAIQRLIDGDDLTVAATLFNPLAIIGMPGSGKSHLVQALVRRWRFRYEAREVAYFTTQDLGRELYAAHSESRIAEWRTELAGCRLLVVEGLERLRRGAAVQRELRQAVDTIQARGGMIVVTADRDPAALNNLDAGLRDRLAAGLAVRLGQPGLAARRAILEVAARSRGLSFTGDVLDELARAEANSVAQLLERLNAPATSDERPRDSQPDAVDGLPESITLKEIMAVAARYFGVTQAALVSHSRRRSLVAARNAVAYLARRLTRLSYGQIGRGLGGRDHTTIMHAERRLADSLPHDGATQLAINELERILRC